MISPVGEVPQRTLVYSLRPIVWHSKKITLIIAARIRNPFGENSINKLVLENQCHNVFIILVTVSFLLSLFAILDQGS